MIWVPAVVAVLVDDLVELVVDDLALAGLVGEDVLEVGDLELDLGQAVDDLLPLEGGQPAQLHVEDRVGLDLVDVEQLDQARAGVVDLGGATDQRDDLVEHVERLDQAAEDVRATLGLARAGSGSGAG